MTDVTGACPSRRPQGTYAPELSRLLSPRAIAIIGASPDPNRFGGRTLPNLMRHGYRGELYAINPHHTEVRGLPCYRSLAEVAEPIDLAIVAVPASGIGQLVDECAEHGVRFAAILSSGFAEQGEVGAAQQTALTAKARARGLRVLGPNCLGFLNVPGKVAAAAAGVLQHVDLRGGNVSVVSRSGALAFSSIFMRGLEHAVRYRYVVSTGNEADLSSADFLNYFIDDVGTSVVVALMEGLGSAQAFAEAAARAQLIGKPIVVLKVGRTGVGRRVAMSHTATLVGSYEAFEAVCGEYGVVAVDDVDELWETAAILCHGKRPDARGVGIVSGSGGLNGLVADHLVALGVPVPSLGHDTVCRLSEVLPPYVQCDNPVDISGSVGIAATAADVDALGGCIDALASDETVGTVAVGVVITTPEFSSALQATAKRMAHMGKLGFLITPGGSVSYAAVRSIQDEGVPVFDSASSFAKAMARAWGYWDYVEDKGEARSIKPAIEARRRPLVSPTSNGLGLRGALDAYGIPRPKEAIAMDLSEARAAAETIGYPVVLKTVASHVLHKTEAGAVATDIRDQAALDSAFGQIFQRAGLLPALVQKMVYGVAEFLLGSTYDNEFGPMVVIGSGGTLVELVDDRVLTRAPVSQWNARRLVRQLRAGQLLAGFRGGPRGDEDALVDAIVAFGTLVADWGDAVATVEVNPFVVGAEGQGGWAVDVLAVLKEG